MEEVGTPILYVDSDLVFNTYPDIFTSKQTTNVDFMSVNWFKERGHGEDSLILCCC